MTATDPVRRFYDALAPEYERARTAAPFARLLSNLDRGFVFTNLVGGPGSTAVEVGSGTGRITERLLDRGLAVTAVDISQNMLDVLTQRFPARVNARRGSLAALPEIPGFGALDNAVALRVLPHLEDAAGGLASLAAAVRPGGRVIFDLWSARGYVGLGRRLGLRRAQVLTRFHRPAEMDAMIAAAGLRVIARRGLGLAPVWPYLLELLGATRIGRLAHIQLFACEVRR